jgi:ribonuclease P protein subunit POP4
MKRTIYPHELIGEKVTIVEAKNPSNVGLQGLIVDETKSTLKIDVKGIIKTVFKKDIVLQMHDNLLKGTELCKRPEERLKGK